MAAHPIRSIPKQLDAAQIAITNTIGDPQIQLLVARYGYAEARMQEGWSLYQAATNTVSAQAAAAGAQRRATLQAAAAERAARKHYTSLAAVARAVFGHAAPEYKALQLRGGMPQGTVAFMAAAATLFDNALAVPEVRATLSEYGYTEERLRAERSSLNTLEQARHAQIAAMSAAVEATRAQTAALAALHAWMVRFRAIARAALADNPQRAERIGIAVRTTPLPSRRGAARASALPPEQVV